MKVWVVIEEDAALQIIQIAGVFESMVDALTYVEEADNLPVARWMQAQQVVKA